MLDDNGDSEYSQPPTGPEYHFPMIDFEDFFAKRAVLLESIGLVCFDPKQTQWRRDIQLQTTQLVRIFRNCMKQIHDNARSGSDFALEIAEFMVADRFERTKYIGRLKPELVPITFVKTELQDQLVHMYFQIVSPAFLFSAVEIIFQVGLQTDIDRAIGQPSL